MNRNEIIYERDITASYMKIPFPYEDNLDVHILLHNVCRGLVLVERCFVNGKGQFWYDISGRQALDHITKFRMLEYSVVERIILRICEQLEILEWNLLDVNGLRLDPEFIFLSNKDKEVSFIYYPQNNTSVLRELQKLMEYLLTKIDHSEYEQVQGAYEVYEITLQEDFNVQELKDAILKNRIKSKKKEEICIEPDDQRIVENETFYMKTSEIEERNSLRDRFQVGEKLSKVYEKIKYILLKKQKQEEVIVVYPQEEEYVEQVVNPTVCLTSVMGEPRGVLMYEGLGNYRDFVLEKKTCIIGKGIHAQLQIERDTVSNLHAKIDYRDGYYIEDLNSTNGTFINDEILNYKESRLLSAGDILRFADVKYRFL